MGNSSLRKGSPVQAPPKGTIDPANQIPGNIRERYAIETRELGHGHYGSVSRCRNIASEEWYACKTIKKSKVKDISSLRREVEILRSTNHPNIIHMQEVFEDDECFYIVMELCTGGELFDRIIEKTKSGSAYGELDAARIMRQIFDALEYCHAQGIVHRDLKPENFVFRSGAADSDLKIIDFGLSRQFEPSGEFMSTRVGTPYYIAPEVLTRRYTEACDLWSTGVVLYILLCGAPPFYGDRDIDIYRMIKTHDVDFPAAFGWNRISDEAKDLIRQLLNKDPAGRPSAAGAKRHPWFALVDTQVVEEARQADAKAGTERSIISDNIGQRLMGFVAMNKLKRVALNVMAQQLTEAEIGELKELFSRIDMDKNGTLSVDELQRALENSHGELQAQIQSLMQGIDVDGDNCLDYREFLAATMQRSAYVKEDRIQRAFDHFRRTNDAISYETLVEILGSEAHASEILKDYDFDGDSRINFHEFKQLIVGDSEMAAAGLNGEAASEAKYAAAGSGDQEASMDAK